MHLFISYVISGYPVLSHNSISPNKLDVQGVKHSTKSLYSPQKHRSRIATPENPWIQHEEGEMLQEGIKTEQNL